MGLFARVPGHRTGKRIHKQVLAAVSHPLRDRFVSQGGGKRRQDCSCFFGHPHSALILAALIIGHHLSISALWRLASACGVCWSRGGISEPRSRSRDRTVASVNVSTAAELSLAMMPPGVPLGAHRPNQNVVTLTDATVRS